MPAEHIDFLLRYIEAPSIKRLYLEPVSSNQQVQSNTGHSLLPRFPVWMHSLVKDTYGLDIAINQCIISLRLRADEDPNPVSMSVDLHIRRLHHIYGLDKIVESLNANLALLNPTVIRFCGHADTVFLPCELSVEGWRTLLLSCPRLTYLILDRDAPLDCFNDAFRDHPDVYPSLKQIHVRRGWYQGQEVKREVLTITRK
ncbi:hypothetical protein SISSUDRAFT_1052597 [Sistotremastrum suecicum HHB10207 ss-3]|uniref:Uncharacterized protein n=1 Tax=Sistotremastrum suecicum HHB10207 ss-3 TaxID=1314776 RepID=A0A165ZRE5_9AGAM|nr:hypothetical protein SISSUDRAFT_1052597 [Sistotremastrum suecicum HHB10207 ss-3]